MLKKIIQNTLGILLVFFYIQTSFADEFNFNFRIRERFEIWDGLNKKAYGDQSIDSKGYKQGEADDRIWLQHLIFGFTYKSRKLSAKLNFAKNCYRSNIW